MNKFYWPLEKAWQCISQQFGVVWSADSNKKHSGVDIAVPVESPVFASSTGIVAKIGLLSATINWGQYVIVEHDEKDYCTTYLHVDPTVKVGDRVSAGGMVGKTARIDSPHLHFGVWSGVMDKVLTPRGALPFGVHVKPSGDPDFPSRFLNPEDSTLFEYCFVEDQNADTAAQNTVGNEPFSQDLKVGDRGPDVKKLQVFLNKDLDTRVAQTGPGSTGNETDSYGTLTENAVKRFQVKHGVAFPGVGGYGEVGPKTRKRLNELILKVTR
ncbi:MAG: peptidoglycan DD-metalloendopeptidase family protein [Patescibacteria group bacterium]